MLVAVHSVRFSDLTSSAYKPEIGPVAIPIRSRPNRERSQPGERNHVFAPLPKEAINQTSGQAVLQRSGAKGGACTDKVTARKGAN